MVRGGRPRLTVWTRRRGDAEKKGESAFVASGLSGERCGSGRPEPFEGDGGGAEDAGVVFQGADADEGAAGRAIGDRKHRFAERFEEHVAHLEEAAAEGDGIGIEDVDEPAEGEAEEVPAVADLGFALLVAGVGGGEEVGGGRVAVADDLEKEFGATGGQELAGAGGEGDATDECFETAARAAVTAGTGRVEDDVADFTGEAAGAAIEAALDDDAASDTGAQGPVEEVSGAPPGAVAELAEGGGAGVVLDEHGKSEGGGEGLGKDEVAESGDVRREDDLALVGVDEAGRADTDGQRRCGRSADDIAEDGDEEGDHLLGGGALRGWSVVARGDVARLGDERGAEVGSTQVGPDDNRRHGIHSNGSARAVARELGVAMTCGPVAWHAVAVLSAWERWFLGEIPVARLGTIAADGRPHIVPVCFALVGERVAIAIDEKPKRAGTLARVKNIERDPRVTLLVDRYSDAWEELAWVRIEGEARVMERGSGWAEGLVALRARYRQYAPMALEQLPLIVIEVERVVSWSWGGGDAVPAR